MNQKIYINRDTEIEGSGGSPENSAHSYTEGSEFFDEGGKVKFPRIVSSKSAEEIFNEIPFLDRVGDHFNIPRTKVLEAMEEYANLKIREHSLNVAGDSERQILLKFLDWYDGDLKVLKDHDEMVDEYLKEK